MRTKEAKAHIDALKAEKSLANANANSVHNALNNLIQSAFTRDHRFSFELLQNADDMSHQGKPIAVRFTLIENKLIFSHNGKHFSKKNVEKICDLMNPEDEKAEDLQTTGYKGIGFKSLFALSDCISIISPPYCFRFDKQTSYQKINGKHLPWHIIPVWTEKTFFSDEINSILDTDEVHFVINLKDIAKVKKELHALINNPNSLLFLRAVRELSIKIGEKETNIRIDEDNDIKTITINDQQYGQWLCHQETLAVPKKVHQEIQALGEHACPAKIKAATEVNLQFAARVTVNAKTITLETDDTALFYAYLPTTVNLHLPFCVNTDFILDAKRNTLQDNAWNQFLCTRIAAQQFAWYAKLARNPQTKNSVLALFAHAKCGELHAAFSNAYDEGFALGMSEHAFIPAENDANSYLYLHKAKLDETGIYRAVNIVDQHSEQLVSSHLISVDRLRENLSAENIIDITFVLNRLEAFAKDNKSSQFQKKLLAFLPTLLKGNAAAQEIIKTKSFVLTEDNRLVSPEALYIRAQGEETPPQFLQVPVLHDSLASDEAICKWLRGLGAVSCKPVDIVNGQVISLIENKAVTKDNVIDLTRYIAQVFTKHRSKLNRDKLTMLPVLTKDGALRPPGSTYLADVYEPELKLGTVFANQQGVLVSSKYIDKTLTRDILRGFFAFIGVHASLSPVIIKTIKRAHLGLLDAQFPDLLAHLKPATNQPNGEHKITHLVTLPLLREMIQPNFASHFWQALVTHWETLENTWRDSKYQLVSRTHSFANNPYLIDYFKQHHCILAVDGKPYPSVALYSPALTELIGFACPKTASVHCELTEMQAQRLGFKTNLSIQDAMQLMDKTVAEYSKTKSSERVLARISLALKSISARIQEDTSLKDTLQKWLQTAKCVALDGCVGLLKDLKVYAIAGSQPESGPDWLPTLPNLTPAEMTQIAENLGLSIIHAEKVQLKVKDKVEDHEIIPWFAKKLASIAIAESYHTLMPPAQRIQQLSDKLAKLRVFSVSSLSLQYSDGHQKSETVYVHEKNLYYTERWKKRQAKIRTSIAYYLEIHPQVLSRLETLFSGELMPSDQREWLEEQGVAKTACDQLSELESMLSHMDLNDDDAASSADLMNSPAQASSSSKPMVGYPKTPGSSPSVSTDDEDDVLLASSEDESQTKAATPTSSTTKTMPLPDPALSWLGEAKLLKVDTTKIDHGKTEKRPEPKMHGQQRIGKRGGNKVKQQPQTEAQIKAGLAKGYWGEKWLYEKFHQTYKAYPDCQRKVERTDNGFSIKITLSDAYLKSDNTLDRHKQKYHSGTVIEYDVKWVNVHLSRAQTFTSIQQECEYVLSHHTELSSAPYDFAISKRVDGKKRDNEKFIDVKTTESEEAKDLTVSQAEWDVMRKYGQRYSLFRVYNAGQNNKALCKEFKNPFKSLVDGNLSPGTVTLNL